jgi:uncharacterized membrane protein YwzB
MVKPQLAKLIVHLLGLAPVWWTLLNVRDNA